MELARIVENYGGTPSKRRESSFSAHTICLHLIVLRDDRGCRKCLGQDKCFGPFDLCA